MNVHGLLFLVSRVAFATKDGNFSIQVEQLMLSGADVNCSNDEGEAGLHWAAYSDSLALLELLLASPGLEVNIRDRHRQAGTLQAEIPITTL